LYRILLDTDPGVDDALALLLAVASPEIKLEAITTVSGNVNVELTTRNALSLLELIGRTDIPVARGSVYPIVRTPVYAEEVYGKNGLGEVILPEPTVQPVEKHAVDLIVETIMRNPGEITLVAIGPLTNLALALRREPGIARQVREVVVMGGALRVPGNVTPSAEFNIYVDPHAAHAVFHAGWPLRLVSLDTTTRTLLTREQISDLVSVGGPVMTCIQQMLTYYFEVFAARENRAAFLMHDPLCLATVFQPDLITWEPVYVDVELTGALTLGETVAFFHRDGVPVPNIQASVAVDADRFLQLYLERVSKAFI
jgi:inosine-uridine nucleoside N-ribohydrolase